MRELMKILKVENILKLFTNIPKKRLYPWDRGGKLKSVVLRHVLSQKEGICVQIAKNVSVKQAILQNMDIKEAQAEVRDSVVKKCDRMTLL